MINEKYIEAMENEGWQVSIGKYDDYLEISKDSPAGEDFMFTIDSREFPRSLYEYYEEYDAEEHAVMWFNSDCQGLPSLRKLLDDAEDIGEMLHDLCLAVDCAKW